MKLTRKELELSCVKEGDVIEQIEDQYSLLTNLMSSLLELSQIARDPSEPPEKGKVVNNPFGRCLS